MGPETPSPGPRSEPTRRDAVPTDEEVTELLGAKDHQIHEVLLFCLLTGMRAGEAAGLLREDLVAKGNLGWFVHVRPNGLRLLKTDAAERLVPLHPVLQERVVDQLYPTDRLFPGLTVDLVTKAFASFGSGKNWSVQGSCSTAQGSGSSPSVSGRVFLSTSQRLWSATSRPGRRTASTRLASRTSRNGA